MPDEGKRQLNIRETDGTNANSALPATSAANEASALPTASAINEASALPATSAANETSARSAARMQELIRLLNEASRAYYSESREIMTNEHYDKLYDELLRLEKETGMIFAGSPTQSVGYEVLSELPKERHAEAALSLDKTKNPEALREFLQDKDGLLSWKLDGLTVVVTYDNGTLTKAVTRGNGEIGEVVTGNAKTFRNLPLSIPYAGHLVLRGEAVISYADFERLNEENSESEKYKNPRNLAAGSVRQLDPEVTKKRSVRLIVFALIEAPDMDFHNSMEEEFRFLKGLGFETVPYRRVNADTVVDAVKAYSVDIRDYAIPSDGLVLSFDDLAFGKSLGRTAKFPRNAIAFKWQDEMAETTILDIEWNASRTGLINPVAVFLPVELEGTTVSRASVHNISICEELALGIGDTVSVYKANMIIPQIAENKTRSGLRKIPSVCPVCGHPTVIQDENGVRTLHCPFADCAAKQIKRFSLLVSRNALNVDGLSEMTLEKFIDAGYITTPADLFRLERHKEAIVSMEHFGEKSYENLMQSIMKATRVTVAAFLYALGIPNIGVAGAKTMAKFMQNDIDAIRTASAETWVQCPDVGEKTAADIVSFFQNEERKQEIDDLLSYLTFAEEEKGEDTLQGKTFVITGDVHSFSNRNELKAFIELHGGKTAGSVSRKTDYLINNDILSSSSKNKAAKEFGIPIITEEEFLQMAGE